MVAAMASIWILTDSDSCEPNGLLLTPSTIPNVTLTLPAWEGQWVTRRSLLS